MHFDGVNNHIFGSTIVFDFHLNQRIFWFEKKVALEYFDRARKVGFGVEKFKYFFRLNQETIDDSLKILTQMEKDL